MIYLQILELERLIKNRKKINRTSTNQVRRLSYKNKQTSRTTTTTTKIERKCLEPLERGKLNSSISVYLSIRR